MEKRSELWAIKPESFCSQGKHFIVRAVQAQWWLILYVNLPGPWDAQGTGIIPFLWWLEVYLEGIYIFIFRLSKTDPPSPKWLNIFQSIHRGSKQDKCGGRENSLLVCARTSMLFCIRTLGYQSSSFGAFPCKWHSLLPTMFLWASVSPTMNISWLICVCLLVFCFSVAVMTYLDEDNTRENHSSRLAVSLTHHSGEGTAAEVGSWPITLHPHLGSRNWIGSKVRL